MISQKIELVGALFTDHKISSNDSSESGKKRRKPYSNHRKIYNMEGDLYFSHFSQVFKWTVVCDLVKSESLLAVKQG